MGLKEMALEIIDSFTEEQLKGFVMLFGSYNSAEEMIEDILGDDTI